MRLSLDGRRSNNAEPIRFQQVPAGGCCVWRQALHVMHQARHVGQLRLHFSCQGLASKLPPPLFPSAADSGGSSEMLGDFVQETCKAGKPAVEAKRVAGFAVAIHCWSDKTLSSTAGENFILLCLLVAARAAISLVFGLAFWKLWALLSP